MVKKKTPQQNNPPPSISRLVFLSVVIGGILITILSTSLLARFEKTYSNVSYPGVRLDGVSVSGKTKNEIETYYAQKSEPLSSLTLTITYEDKIASISGEDLALSFDGKLAAEQAFRIGRSGNILSDTYQKWRAFSSGINLTSILTMKTDVIDDTLANLSIAINIEPQDALFQFKEGKVLSFRPSKDGRKLDNEEAKKHIQKSILSFTRQENLQSPQITLDLPVRIVEPNITTENSNNYGIKELLGTGSSKFRGSIPGRKHNIDLASKKLSGHLIPPGGEFSFNTTLGDVSASTGFQPAYIIKEGRTVLGDGGGVCQVSTTLFRAAIQAGLPITERHAHSYRVGYYEQDSPPGIDATVFAPSYDLKFKNDTSHYILIQSRVDLVNETLEFDLFGTKDGREIEITKPVIYSQTPPPPDLYQDDPTIPKDVIKQVDWKAWGAKVSFDYKVKKNGSLIFEKSFFSNFQPWQSVFLRGTKE